MAKYTMYALNTLPSTGIDVNGVYFIPASGNKFNVYIRKNDNSVWYNLGLTSSVDSVNGLSGAVALDLEFNTSTGVLTMTGSGSSINLDTRYRKKTDNVPWAEISGAPTFALDADVVHKTGAETVAGVKTFSDKPIVPTPTSATHVANKSYVDGVGSGLQGQIDNLTSAVTNGMKTPTDIDCSTNPNYPAATKGDGWVVTVAGKIGGASGVEVRKGAEIRCKTTSAGGTHAAVGANFYILESDLDQATETVPGFAKVATQALVNGGTNDTDFVTAKKLQVKMDADNATQSTAMDGKYVRYDAVQALSNGQMGTARGNIQAAKDSEVVKLAGAGQTVSSEITFSTLPKASTAPTVGTQLTNKTYVDATVQDYTNWGGPTGKEW